MNYNYDENISLVKSPFSLLFILKLRIRTFVFIQLELFAFDQLKVVNYFYFIIYI
jgi:hypothetical protein